MATKCFVPIASLVGLGNGRLGCDGPRNATTSLRERTVQGVAPCIKLHLRVPGLQ